MPSEFQFKEPPLALGILRSRPWYGTDIFWNHPLYSYSIIWKLLQMLEESLPQCWQVILVVIHKMPCHAMFFILSGKSKCQLHKTKALAFSSIGLQPVGRFVPQCEADGSYSKIQCWASTGYCWCSDKNGTELEGTRVRGQPNCPSGRSSMCCK